MWVVEGKLADGQSHVAPRRRFYVDEDTWFVVYSESWDEDGRLWKFGHGTMYMVPELPAVILGSQFIYDLVLGGYVFSFAFNEIDTPYTVVEPHAETVFAPQGLARRGVR